MSNELHPVWQQVELLINDGISLVPVRDRDETTRGKLYPKKSPYAEWKQYQAQRINRQELFHQMEAHNTTAVAMVCGAISGNLEAIDVDVKYLPGIDARLFADLKELYPDLLAKLRVHKSPSGGCHIIYRIEHGHEVPRSTHLAERHATEEELTQNPKLKSKCFIETRGEGGLICAPPSIGYTVRKDCPIPVLTWTERCTLIELCRSYNTYIKPDKPYKPNRAEFEYYDENPFEHYNRTCDARALLEQFGWTYVHNRNGYLLFTKPGGRKGDVHASFNTADRYYFIFSTNTDFDSDRAYNPASILAYYQFNDDKQKTYAWLVDNGYGRIKQHIEQSVAKRAAISGNELPKNISKQAEELYKQTVEQLNTQHPYGIFWELDKHDEVKISRERLYQVAEALGFRYNEQTQGAVQIVDQFIHLRNERYFYDTLKAYIHEQDGDLLEDICNAYEAFVQKNGDFTITRLQLLDHTLILTDTRTTCYKFYQNGYVTITATDIQFNDYAHCGTLLIWAANVQKRDYTHTDVGGVYVDFLNNATNLMANRQHIMRAIGYLAHDYKDETTGYIIVLTEQCADPLEGGGTGKNMFCNLFGLTTTYTSIPGSQADMSKNFLQSWNGQRIFAVSDAEEKFPFHFLKELSTGTAMVKKLFKNDQTFTVNDLPKFIIQTNFSFNITDGGLKRRIIFIEFTDFFTKSGGVKKHYGKLFPTDWTADDYAGYDTFICQCVQQWMANGCELTNVSISDTGWEKQFTQNFGDDTMDFIRDHFDRWTGNNTNKEISLYNSELQKLYDDFMLQRGRSYYRVKFRKLNNAMAAYFDKHGYTYHKDKSMRNPMTDRNEKGVLILSKDPPF